MTPRSILLTGASGFVGGYLAPELRRRFPEAELHAPRFDLTDARAVEAAVAAARPDACVHLAAVAAVPTARADPARTWAVNLYGTLGLARALLRLAPGCALVFTSSADAYGASFLGGAALDEAAPLVPQNTYAATKAAADLALGAMAAADGLHVVRVRAFNHTGPGQSEAFVVAAFAAQAARIAAGLQEPVLRVGDLSARRDFLDVRDVCSGYAACIARAESLPPGTILNLASGTPRSVGEALDALLSISGVRARVEADPARLRPSDIPLAYGNAARARALLGWAPRVPWEQTLRDVVADWTTRVRRQRSDSA